MHDHLLWHTPPYHYLRAFKKQRKMQWPDEQKHVEIKAKRHLQKFSKPIGTVSIFPIKTIRKTSQNDTPKPMKTVIKTTILTFPKPVKNLRMSYRLAVWLAYGSKPIKNCNKNKAFDLLKPVCNKNETNLWKALGFPISCPPGWSRSASGTNVYIWASL